MPGRRRQSGQRAKALAAGARSGERARIDALERKRLTDVMCDCPRVLLVGINPGLRSAELGHHFGGRTNPFWRLLHVSGLTPVLLDPTEDHRLAEFGLALTNLCARPTRSAAELSRAEMEEGHAVLEEKIARLRPRIVAFVGLTLYQSYFGKPSGGAGAKPERIHEARVFVLPNPSGLNANFPGFGPKLVWFEELAKRSARLERRLRVQSTAHLT